MKRLQKAALLVTLVDELRDNGSWCGETHIQKATYFLQSLLNVPTGFEFILYKHGPFSFDLRDELTALRADGIFELKRRPYPYGPSLVTSEMGNQLKQRFPKTLAKYGPHISFVADKLGHKGVAELEKLATALFVRTHEAFGKSDEERVLSIHELKPHVSISDAAKALEELKDIMNEAEKCLVS